MKEKLNISGENENTGMSKRRILKNLIVVSFGFMLLFSAFNALSKLQSTMNNAGNIGVISQSTIYTMFTAGALFLPKIVIKKFGCKLTVVFSMMTYLPYMAANVHPSPATLIPTAAVLGTGASTLWASANTYINRLSFLYVKANIEKAEVSSSTFFGIFHVFFQTTEVWGNLVLFYVFSQKLDVSISSYSSSDYLMKINETSLTCGAEFCGRINGTPQSVSDEQRYILIGIYCSISVLAVIIVSFFMDALKNQDGNENTTDTALRKFAATVRQMIRIDQLLLTPITIFIGLQNGFLFSDYSQAYVACGLSLEYIGLVFVCYGIVSSVAAFCAGFLLKYVTRVFIMTTTALCSTGVLLALWFWNPSKNVNPYFILVGFWAVSFSFWVTQLSALYGTLFQHNEEAAFANCEINKSLGYLIAFSSSSVLCTTSKIYMVFGFLVCGIVGYYAIELRNFRNNSVSKPE